jgi:hypothetical protein
MYGDILGGGDTDPHLVALDPQDSHGNRVTDHQGFADAAGQDQHAVLLYRRRSAMHNHAMARRQRISIISQK